MKTNNHHLNKKGNVLITGASTGIGYATAIYLDKQGFKIYAGVRNVESKTKLSGSSENRITPVILDVCDPISIQNTYKIIKDEVKNEPFYLVNNAGLSINGPLELLDFSDIKKVIDVNLTGLLTVTKIFLPLIRKSQGRIINISSGHGLLAIPDKSVYAASKFGVQAVSDSLRIELRSFGVKVSNIIVGKVKTNVLGKILNDREKMISRTEPNILDLYKNLIEYFDKEVKDIPGIEATKVSKIIHKAISDLNPKAKYLIGTGAKKMSVLGKFPVKMRDNMLYKAIYK